MARLAQWPNVQVKISGLGQAGRAWRAIDNAWIVREMIAMFGTRRAMFASNFPVDSLCGSFDDIYSGFKSIVADLPDGRSGATVLQQRAAHLPLRALRH